MNKRDVGAMGEGIAEKWLEKRGFTCLCRNYYSRYGEIDLICEKDKTLYFVEVKYRRSLYYGNAINLLNKGKVSRMRQTASKYISENYKAFIKYKLSYIGILEMDSKIEYTWIEDLLV